MPTTTNHRMNEITAHFSTQAHCWNPAIFCHSFAFYFEFFLLLVVALLLFPLFIRAYKNGDIKMHKCEFLYQAWHLDSAIEIHFFSMARTLNGHGRLFFCI